MRRFSMLFALCVGGAMTQSQMARAEGTNSYEVADATPVASAAPAAGTTCDPYQNFGCLDSNLGDGFFSRLFNYYSVEWGQAGAPADPHAPSARQDGYPPAAQTSSPMPFTEWPYGGTTLLGVNRPASVDSPLMVAMANTWLGKLMAEGNMQIYGWVNGGGNVSTSTQREGGNAPAAYSYRPNTVQLDQFVLYFERTPDTVQTDHVDWGFRLSGIYGENYRYTTAYGVASYQYLTDNRLNGYDFPMVYGELYIPQVADGLMLRLGRYISLPDIEAQLAPNNYMYTHSMTYTLDNYTNTGLQSTLALNKQWFLQLGVSAGTEASIGHLTKTIQNPDPNPIYPSTTFKADPGAMASYTACVRYNSMDGKDDFNACADAINKGTWGYNNLQWNGFTYYHKFNDKWHLAYEAYYMYLNGVPNELNPTVQAINAAGGTPFTAPQSNIHFNAPNEAQCNNPTVLTCKAKAYGTVAYLNYSPDPMNNFSIRPEFYYDEEGQRTGTATRYANFALGWQHWFSPQVEVRPEIAYYHSLNANAFNGDPNDGVAPNKDYLTMISGDIIWHF